jgi:hypothetical protein
METSWKNYMIFLLHLNKTHRRLMQHTFCPNLPKCLGILIRMPWVGSVIPLFDSVISLERVSDEYANVHEWHGIICISSTD